MRRRWAGVLALALAASLVLAGCSDDGEPGGPDEPTRTPTPRPVALTFGVFGTQAEVAPYQEMVDGYNAEATTVQVELQSWPSSDAMLTDVEQGDPLPDVFLLARTNLPRVLDAELTTPLFGLLEERDISYGDGYAHEGLEAFSAENDLQCMPYDISPRVVYYNTDLVDFTTMQARGLPVPSEKLDGWTFEEFQAAVRFASRKRLGTKGLNVTPTLDGIAPFLYSGGGSLFDDDSEPTSLDLASDANVETLTTLLELARNPRVTLSEEQLAKATPMEWFKRGKLAMVTDYRSLTPELRALPGFHFDVLPIPRLDSKATLGQLSGLCIARGRLVQKAADFLVHAISDEGVATVARAGYLVPANLSVGRSEAFLQPDQQPAHAGAFNASVDRVQVLPLLNSYGLLEDAAAPGLQQLLHSTVLDDVAAVTEQIDELSRPILDPTYVPESPSESPSGSPSESPSGSPSASPSDSAS